MVDHQTNGNVILDATSLKPTPRQSRRAGTTTADRSGEQQNGRGAGTKAEPQRSQQRSSALTINALTATTRDDCYNDASYTWLLAAGYNNIQNHMVAPRL
nr:hypothetical protein CFP56_69061 [Quercus suber]